MSVAGPVTRPASRRAAAAAAGWVMDQALGEPVVLAPHPVTLLGRRRRSDPVDPSRPLDSVASAQVIAGVAAGAAAGAVLRSTSVATYVSVAGRSVGESARSVGQALDAGGVERAREEVAELVDADPSQLDEREIVRAVVASVAENTLDAVVAPLVWAAAAGAPGVFAYRAVDVLDRSSTFGARPAATWLPSRATVVLVAAVRPRAARAVWAAARRAASSSPAGHRRSPDDAVVRAAFGAALGVDLDGRSDRRGPDRTDVDAAVRLSAHVSAAAAAGLAIPWALSTARRRISVAKHARSGGFSDRNRR